MRRRRMYVRKRDCRKKVAYLFFARKNKMYTVAGELVAVQYFHRRAGIERPMRNPYLLQVKSGLARESAIHGEATRTRRPVSWVLLKHGIGLASEWGEGGRVLWLTLAVSYFFMCRASELYATSNGTVHKEFCLTRKDVRFLVGNRRVTSPALWRSADRVEVLLRQRGTTTLRSFLRLRPHRVKCVLIGNTRVRSWAMEGNRGLGVSRWCWN